MTTSEKTLRIHKAMLKNRRAARAALAAMQRKKGRNQGRAAVALEATVARRDKLDKDLYIQLKFVHSELRRLEEHCTALEDRVCSGELLLQKKAVIKSNTDTMLEMEEEDTYDGGSSGVDYFTPPGPSPLRYQLDQVDGCICHEEGSLFAPYDGTIGRVF